MPRSALLLALPVLLLSSCEFDNTQPGPMRDDPVSVDLANAERANVQFNMGAGELVLRGGASKLLEGHFEYNGDRAKPLVRADEVGSHATVTVREPDHPHFSGKEHYLWNLQLNDKVLLDLSVNCGAGQDRLDLGDLNLRNVEVHMGAGQVNLNLEGHPTRDYDVNISGGVGQATVHLPEGVGVRAEAHGGIGEIHVTGLQKRGDHWENDLYDNAKVNVRLRVNGGIGQIRIIG